MLDQIGVIEQLHGAEEIESHEDVAVDTAEEIVDAEGREKAQTRVKHSIVFVTAEAAPYSKTGGLGDVCGSLPIALASRGHRVMVVSPRYLHGSPQDKNLVNAVDLNCRVKVYCFGGAQEVSFFHEYREGVDWVFVDHPSYHRPGNPYGDGRGAFGDNQFRFTVLCHAACEAPLVLPLGGYTYGEKCLFLANDWHASLVPVLLAAKYHPFGVYKDARSVLVIHNLAHQGVEPAVTYKNFGLPPEWYGALEWVFPTWARTHALDTGEAVNILKGAIVTADRILTVSKGYSWEITTVEGGYGLHELLSSRRSVLNGVTNGINVSEWDPSSDEHIAFHYSADDLSGKVQCKIALQKELGLPVRPDCPLIGFIGRLDYQKGIDLIRWAVPELMEDDIQFVMLGSGDRLYEEWMRVSESTYRDKFRGWVGFNVPISHRITAGCDILLMPSRFEPCGLNQLYAMRYGTVPVVHGTGGLRDTVQTFDPFAQGGAGEGTGWTFSPLSKESMLSALRLAILTYRDHKASWDGIMKRGMQRDYTWENAAIQYEQVFEWAFIDRPYIS
ncbi:starch synthase 1, chloroplastic/amyloplastic isoform X3 [Jatropha curcas]|uniref:starch synthase 1, chloroplastic/amyloplastic isoform X3 n=1 Tax=Jatropha curcas TaxID=180498 RepID=UPI0009D640EB|nr:starch synthase 1, chloroplastic/amyloplastic isoform X3 [Jatropha curcas]